MAEFGLIKSFDIDSGELDGLTPQECFVLGYELAEIDAAVKSHMPSETWMELVIHAQHLSGEF